MHHAGAALCSLSAPHGSVTEDTEEVRGGLVERGEATD